MNITDKDIELYKQRRVGPPPETLQEFLEEFKTMYEAGDLKENKIVTTAVLEEIKSFYKKGASAKIVAILKGVSIHTVQGIYTKFRAAGIPRGIPKKVAKGVRVEEKEKRKILKLCKEGVTLNKIQEETGRSLNTIKGILKKEGVDTTTLQVSSVTLSRKERGDYRLAVEINADDINQVMARLPLLKDSLPPKKLSTIAENLKKVIKANCADTVTREVIRGALSQVRLLAKS